MYYLVKELLTEILPNSDTVTIGLEGNRSMQFTLTRRWALAGMVVAVSAVLINAATPSWAQAQLQDKEILDNAEAPEFPSDADDALFEEDNEVANESAEFMDELSESVEFENAESTSASPSQPSGTKPGTVAGRRFGINGLIIPEVVTTRSR